MMLSLFILCVSARYQRAHMHTCVITYILDLGGTGWWQICVAMLIGYDVCVYVFEMKLDMDGQLLSSAREDSHHLFLSQCCHHNDQIEICSHWELLLQHSTTHTHTHIKPTIVHTQETHKHLLKTSQLLSKSIAMSPTHIVRSIYRSMLTFFQPIKNSSVFWTLRYGIIGSL